MIGFFKASSFVLSLFGLMQIGLMMNKSSSSSVDNFSLRKSANINVVSNTFDQAEDNVNIVNYDMSSKNVSFEIFDENYYEQYENSGLTRTVHGKDERTSIGNPKDNPYLPCAYMKITYTNVENQKTGKHVNKVSWGTAFLEGPNLAVSAGHCVYKDVTSEGDYDDGEVNPRFPDKIEFFFGCSGTIDLEQGDNYQYYALAKSVHIEYSFYKYDNNQIGDHDWSAIVLDRDIGRTIGWYGKISNFKTNSYDIFTWGYPGDKEKGTLWKSQGNIDGYTEYQYKYYMDTYNGQSGSPIFMKSSDGSVYVCGIHTQGKSSCNYGIIINDLIFSYLNSYVTTNTSAYSYQPLMLYVNAKSGSTWKIRISNQTSHFRRVYYNSKMCFNDDAKNWNKLNNVNSVTIDPYSAAYVFISENWFATTIAVSYQYNNCRIISYADNLDATEKTLSQYTSVI